MTAFKTVFAVCAWWFLFAGAAHAQDGSEVGLDRMIRQIENLVPDLEGTVLAVDGDTVTVDLKRGQAVNPGDVYKLIRLGEEIIHPATKEVVGHKETDLGEIRIEEVRKDYSTGKVLKAAKPPRQGDRVRSPFRKFSLLVAPVVSKVSKPVDTGALALEIESRLNEHPRFRVPPFDLRLWLLENGVTLEKLTDQKNLEKLRGKVRADYILFPELQMLKGKMVLAYRMVSAKDGAVLEEARMLAPSLPTRKRRQEQDMQTDLRGGEKGPLTFVNKQEFEFVLVDFAAGDVTGDGKTEYVLIDDHRVMLYRFENGRFVRMGQASFKKGANKFLSVDVADINSNGRAEIFVTNQWGDSRLKSFALEMKPNRKGLAPVWKDVNRYLRVLRDFDGKPRLIAQRPGYDAPFLTGIRTVRHKGGRYEEGDELEIQSIMGKDFIVYGLAQGDINGDRNPETIILDKYYRLRVYSPRGRLLVKSGEYFGQDPRVIDLGVKTQITGLHNSPDDPQPEYFRGRPLLVRHRGKKYLLLPKNYKFGGDTLSKSMIIQGSAVAFLRINPDGLERFFETRRQDGYLAAFQVVDVPGTEEKLFHAAMVSDKGGVFKGEKITTILTYRW